MTTLRRGPSGFYETSMFVEGGHLKPGMYSGPLREREGVPLAKGAKKHVTFKMAFFAKDWVFDEMRWPPSGERSRRGPSSSLRGIGHLERRKKDPSRRILST